MKEITDGWWHEDIPKWMGTMFGDDTPWLFWLPELMREIAGSPHCAMPALPTQSSSLQARVNAWGPLLPLLHFHLGWPRIDVGLLNWARSGFDAMNDPTLRVIFRHWGAALPVATLWSFERSGAPGPSTAASPQLIATLHREANGFTGAGPGGLHLENHYSLECAGHWSSAYRPREWGTGRPTEVMVEQRHLDPGGLTLILPTYANWYGALEEVGERLSPLPNGRSWRIDLTIAPIGYVGKFRRSRESGRWFTGRHRAHALGVG